MTYMDVCTWFPGSLWTALQEVSVSFPLLDFGPCLSRASRLALAPAAGLAPACCTGGGAVAPAPCGTLPPPHLAIDIPERAPPHILDFGQHTGGSCVNVGTDVWSVLLLCIMAPFA